MQKASLENGIIYIQLKATDRIKYRRDKLSISFTISKKDINTWYLEPFPVILVLYDAQGDVAYWLYIQQYLVNLSDFDLNEINNNFSVSIPITNVVNVQVFKLLREYKLNILKQLVRIVSHK